MAFKQYSETKSPKELFDLASNRDDDAIAIWEVFGSKLGLCISHIINLLDPAIITMGGGISNAFPYFNNSLFEVIKKYSPSFSYNKIDVNVSSNPLGSVHFGAALAINQNKYSFVNFYNFDRSNLPYFVKYKIPSNIFLIDPVGYLDMIMF